MTDKRKKVVLYADGSSLGNPGPGVGVLFFYIMERKRLYPEELLIQQTTGWNLQLSLKV